MLEVSYLIRHVVLRTGVIHYALSDARAVRQGVRMRLS